MKIGIYAGSFDPPTLGHCDIIEKASKLVDRLIVSVGVNPAKKGLFSRDERLAMLNGEIARLERGGRVTEGVIRADTFQGLLVTHAAQQGATHIFRGLRVSSDFDYEFMLNGVNQDIDPEITTVFLMAPQKILFISSSAVRELAANKEWAAVGRYVSPVVSEALLAKFSEAP